VQDVAWLSVARTDRPSVQARCARRGGRDHRQFTRRRLPRATTG